MISAGQMVPVEGVRTIEEVIARSQGHVRDPLVYNDRTVQQWHAMELPGSFGAIDVDLFGYCGNRGSPCYYWPMYVIEAAKCIRVANGYKPASKPTGVVEEAARRLGVPVLLVLHEDFEIRFWRQEFPKRTPYSSDVAALAERIRLIRAAHAAVLHPEPKP